MTWAGDSKPQIISRIRFRNDVDRGTKALEDFAKDTTERFRNDVDRGLKATEDFTKDTTERFMTDVGRGLKAADNITKGIGRWLGFR